MPDLGKVKQIDAREIWPNEALDFTPWLQKNIQFLADELDIDIDIIESEGEIGDYRVDLVGKDLNTGRPLIIENQLGPTDHDHLGKFLTYASGKDVGVAIWVATAFRDEHLQTLEWLNTISSENQHFFGVEITVLKIGESKPAPKFNVVVKPSDWIKLQRAQSRKLTEREKAYEEFFTELISKLRERIKGFTSAKKGQPAGWYHFSAGKSGFEYSVAFTKDSRFRVGLYIGSPEYELNKRAFDTFFADKDVIEKGIGTPLSWERLDDKKASRISVEMKGNITDSETKRTELQDWAIEMLRAFITLFRTRIKQVKK